jgi:hypothetical protein
VESDFEAAHAELGLEYPSTPAAVRAAYLKLLKTRKPDQDPDGFRRLRSAYELLKSHGGRDQGSYPLPLRGRPIPRDSSNESFNGEQPDKQTTALHRTLQDLANEPFSSIKRIRTLEQFHERNPADESVALMLARALLEAGLEEAASDLLSDLLRSVKGPGLLLVWRFMLAEAPKSLSRYHLSHPPDGLEPAETLGAAKLLVDGHREPTQAARLIQRLLREQSAERIAPVSGGVLHLLMSIGAEGFVADVLHVARESRARLDAPEAELLEEWMGLAEQFPDSVMRQLSWAVFAHGNAQLTVDFTLSPSLHSALVEALGRRAPRLRLLLPEVLPLAEAPPPRSSAPTAFLTPRTTPELSRNGRIAVAAVVVFYLIYVLLMEFYFNPR